MAGSKASPLAMIRKQAAAHNNAMRGASAGSAVAFISRSNETVKYGFKRTYDDLDRNELEIFTEPVRKRVKAIPRRTIRRKEATPPTPEVESWRPAGGDKPTTPHQIERITDTLGLARLSTWRIDAFQESADKLIEQHGLDFEEVTTVEVIHGGESVTDVLVRFRSEVVAEAVKEKIDGEIVEGRKLQVTFA